MDVIDPYSLKILRYMIKKRKEIIKKHKKDRNPKYNDKQGTFTSFNELKELFPYHPWTSITLPIASLNNKKWIIQSYITPKNIDELMQTDKDVGVIDISAEGWSAVKSYYFNIFLLGIIPTITFFVSITSLIISIFFK